MLRFRDFGVFVFDLGVFVFEFWVLRFRDLGASCFGLRFRVLRFRNYRQLHWLPVVKRIQFKILLLTFKAIHGLSPPYISELITVKPKSTYGLRSNISTLLLPPTQKMLPTLGARSFAAAAPALWNKLPAHIRNVASLNSFKKSIKTFFFNESL